jgi:DNA-binding transcriptional ArsR family regulator
VRSSPPPCAPSFPARTLRALHARTCDLVEAYWDAAFAAEWARVEPRVDAAARAGERLVAAAGVHALLGLLRPRLTVDRAGGVATLRCGVDELEPGEEEHVIECSFRDAPEVALYPSFFSWPHVWMGVDPGWPAGITLPIHMLAGADRPRVPPDDLARLLRACGDDVRLRILRLLAECPRSTQELARLLGLSAPTLSRHLRTLDEAGLLASRREGYWVLYRLRAERIAPLSDALLGYLGLDAARAPPAVTPPRRA